MMVRAIEELQGAGVEPDIWKIEAPIGYILVNLSFVIANKEVRHKVFTYDAEMKISKSSLTFSSG